MIEFSFKPIDPNQKQAEDNAFLNGLMEGIHQAGYSGDDVTYLTVQALKSIGRYDLLPPCERDRSEGI